MQERTLLLTIAKVLGADLRDRGRDLDARAISDALALAMNGANDEPMMTPDGSVFTVGEADVVIDDHGEILKCRGGIKIAKVLRKKEPSYTRRFVDRPEFVRQAMPILAHWLSSMDAADGLASELANILWPPKGA